MSINDRLKGVSNKLESTVKANTEEVYNRITWINKGKFRKDVVSEFAVKKAKAKKEWYDNGQFDDERVIEKEVMIRYNKSLNEYMDKKWYSLDFEERSEDGKEVMVYTLTKKVKEFKMDINFDYTLDFWKEITDVEIV